jgi:pre-mRNA-splicing helicase BRR2
LYSSSDNALVCAPTGSGKTVCAEFAVLQMIASVEAKQAAHDKDESVLVPPLRAVYVASLADIVKQTAASWEKKFGEDGLGLTVVQLTGEQQVCHLAHAFLKP